MWQKASIMPPHSIAASAQGTESSPITQNITLLLPPRPRPLRPICTDVSPCIKRLLNGPQWTPSSEQGPSISLFKVEKTGGGNSHRHLPSQKLRLGLSILNFEHQSFRALISFLLVPTWGSALPPPDSFFKVEITRDEDTSGCLIHPSNAYPSSIWVANNMPYIIDP